MLLLAKGHILVITTALGVCWQFGQYVAVNLESYEQRTHIIVCGQMSTNNPF